MIVGIVIINHIVNMLYYCKIYAKFYYLDNLSFVLVCMYTLLIVYTFIEMI